MEISKNTHDVMKGSKWNPATLSDTDKRRRHPLTGTVFILSVFAERPLTEKFSFLFARKTYCIHF